ncbi:hypothetical protein L9F63_025174, partial [Diploptera punctata]
FHNGKMNLMENNSRVVGMNLYNIHNKKLDTPCGLYDDFSILVDDGNNSCGNRVSLLNSNYGWCNCSAGKLVELCCYETLRLLRHHSCFPTNVIFPAQQSDGLWQSTGMEIASYTSYGAMVRPAMLS